MWKYLKTSWDDLEMKIFQDILKDIKTLESNWYMLIFFIVKSSKPRLLPAWSRCTHFDGDISWSWDHLMAIFGSPQPPLRYSGGHRGGIADPFLPLPASSRYFLLLMANNAIFLSVFPHLVFSSCTSHDSPRCGPCGSSRVIGQLQAIPGNIRQPKAMNHGHGRPTASWTLVDIGTCEENSNRTWCWSSWWAKHCCCGFSTMPPPLANPQDGFTGAVRQDLRSWMLCGKLCDAARQVLRNHGIVVSSTQYWCGVTSFARFLPLRQAMRNCGAVLARRNLGASSAQYSTQIWYCATCPTPLWCWAAGSWSPRGEEPAKVHSRIWSF